MNKFSDESHSKRNVITLNFKSSTAKWPSNVIPLRKPFFNKVFRAPFVLIPIDSNEHALT